MSREGELGGGGAVAAAGRRPHVVLVPVPAQGHINPVTSIARYLAASGICVTLVHAARAHSLLTAAAGAAANGSEHLSSMSDGSSESENHNICVEVIPDGLPSAEAKQSVSVEEVGASMAVMRQGLEELLRRLMQQQTNAPCCLMVDSILGWGSDVALQFGLPVIDVWTSSASSLSIGIHIPHLLAKGYLPARDKESRERTIDCVPGLSSLCIADLPPLFITEEGLQSPPFQFIRSVFENTKGAERVLVNTIHELENAAVEHLRKEGGVRIDPVGPLFMIQNSLENCRAPASLLREDNSCLPWLDKQQSSSVLYVSFGSVASVEEDVFGEVAHGLEASGEPFLWVIRPDALSSIAATVEELLPQGFVERTRDQGLVISWAPQLAVLGHPSVGAFLTHCGWNSVLESLSNGVPMLGFPQLVDQRTNLKHTVHDWKVGLSLVSLSDDQAVMKVERSHVQSCVTAIMRGDEGTTAQNAIRGTSKSNLQKLVDDLKRGHFKPSVSASN